MRAGYALEMAALQQRLDAYEAVQGPLAGIADPTHRETLIEQLVDSIQRERHFHRIAARSYGPDVADPRLPETFHPVKAAVFHQQAGDLDEACWLVFLYVHFGKHRTAGWNWPRLVYGRLDGQPPARWTWTSVFADPLGFQYWLDQARPTIAASPGGFGNHRKYLSLNAWSPNQTGTAVHGYVSMIADAGGSHASWLAGLTDPDTERTFGQLMQAARTVPSFGRTAGFDLVTALARLGLVSARAPHTYMAGATGPLHGTRLLVTGSAAAPIPAREAQSILVGLANTLQVGPEVLEDAVCNWQKHPDRYVRFSA